VGRQIDKVKFGGITMATEAQIGANRSNAQKSTGPRTPEGKAKVAQNALTHGLLAREAVIKGEDPEEFALYRDQMLEELAPAGPVECLLAQRIVGLSWRLQRAERLQGTAFDTLGEEKQTAKPIWSAKGWEVPPPAKLGPEEQARRVVQDFGEARILDRLLVYERRIEGSLYRTMAELEKRQRRRREREAGDNGEEVSSLKREVSGRHGGPEREPPADFTLDNLLGAIAALEATPDGVTTSTRAAPSCETNPISAGARGTGAAPSGQALPVVENHGQDASLFYTSFGSET
jgi:hypothetical protein